MFASHGSKQRPFLIPAFLDPKISTTPHLIEFFGVKHFSDTSVKILAFGAQNITKEPH